jgi:hypothetical protein
LLSEALKRIETLLTAEVEKNEKFDLEAYRRERRIVREKYKTGVPLTIVTTGFILAIELLFAPRIVDVFSIDAILVWASAHMMVLVLFVGIILLWSNYRFELKNLQRFARLLEEVHTIDKN